MYQKLAELNSRSPAKFTASLQIIKTTKEMKKRQWREKASADCIKKCLILWILFSPENAQKKCSAVTCEWCNGLFVRRHFQLLKTIKKEKKDFFKTIFENYGKLSCRFVSLSRRSRCIFPWCSSSVLLSAFLSLPIYHLYTHDDADDTHIHGDYHCR